MRKCKTCGILFNPTKRKNQTNCEEHISLSAKEKFAIRKQTAFNISNREKNLPLYIFNDDILDPYLVDSAHIGDKLTNNNMGKGDKRARNNPSDIPLTADFDFYQNEISKTVPMFNSYHKLLDRRHDKKYIKEKGGGNDIIFELFEDYIDYFIEHKK